MKTKTNQPTVWQKLYNDLITSLLYNFICLYFYLIILIRNEKT